MYFINKAVSEILKNTQTTGDYVLLLLQIRHYDDWQVILGVSQTHQLIREVTQTLEKALSAFENLVVKNFNGDMIGIFCHILTTDTEIERLKLIIIKQFEAPINVGYYNIFVNFHQGITKIPVGDSDIDMSQDALINLVTNMIDSSKRLISMHHEHSKIDVRDLSLPQDSNIIQLSTDLRYAPERGQINAYYAPIVDLRKGVTVGFNISPVWRHPDFGIIAGDLLHYLSERCQMENTINRLVIAKSIEGMVKLYRSQKMPIMNFAISRNLVLGARIDEEIKNLCDILKISPSLFRLEFSADCLGDNPKWLGNILTDLKSIGVTTVLNGFGSAKGQLASLANLAFDRVIIDSGFADNIIHNERKFFALKSVTTMLKNMSIKADIKDVSSTESFKLLFNAGISNISGSAIGEPMPVERAVNLLTNHAQVN
jgi:EAL domain-containing protein (putative c-di-GMP-specific phosphodiesterase class I)/GGDEF domain-containing protein